MARTKRNIAHKHYWGYSKNELENRLKEDRVRLGSSPWSKKYLEWREREILLYGTEAMNHSPKPHEYFNRANRVGRRVARDQLRPHMVLDEDFDFDDSQYRRKYKGVWWEIY